MKHTIKILGILLFAFMLSSCSKDGYDDSNPPGTATKSYRAELHGLNEVPATPSTATASFLASYNSYSKTLTYSLTYTSITPTMAHIHKGAAGTNGSVQFDLGGTGPSPLTGTIILDPAQLSDLNSGMYYVNIHSTAYPDGEIRGQVFEVK